MKVKNFDGNHGPVRNQFEIEDDQGNTYFQSYDSVIAKRGPDGEITLDSKAWDYSVTTGRYRNIFLGENKAETEKKIKAGTYKMGNLNE